MRYPTVNLGRAGLGQTPGLDSLAEKIREIDQYLSDYCSGPEPVHDCDAVSQKRDRLMGAYLELQRVGRFSASSAFGPAPQQPFVSSESSFTRVQQMNENPYSWNVASGQPVAPEVQTSYGGAGGGYGNLFSTAMNFGGGGTAFTMGRIQAKPLMQGRF